MYKIIKLIKKFRNPQIKYSTANLSILHLRQSFSQGDTITSLAR